MQICENVGVLFGIMDADVIPAAQAKMALQKKYDMESLCHRRWNYYAAAIGYVRGDSVKIGVKIRKKGTLQEHDPGHMYFFWKLEDMQQPKCIGFLCDVSDFPEEFKPSHKWREYLLNNKVVGYIQDDIQSELLSHKCPDKFIGVEQEIDDSDSIKIGKDKKLQIGPCGFYSFNPDTFDCDNCVTWAIKRHNKYSSHAKKLNHIQNGRIKEAVKELELWKSTHQRT